MNSCYHKYHPTTFWNASSARNFLSTGTNFESIRKSIILIILNYKARYKIVSSRKEKKSKILSRVNMGSSSYMWTEREFLINKIYLDYLIVIGPGNGSWITNMVESESD